MIQIVDYIKSHNGLPVSSRNLSEAFGISGFEVRRRINIARSEGCPICSCNKGYYYSEDKDEIEKTVKSLNSRIGSIQRAITGLSIYLEGNTGNDTIFIFKN